MTVKLLIEQYLEFLCLTGGCTGSHESPLVKMPHCWKSHVTAQLLFVLDAVNILNFEHIDFCSPINCSFSELQFTK